MPISKGRSLMLKTGTGGSAVSVASMRATRFIIDGETVDATTKDSAGQRMLLADGGVSKVQISASGVLSGTAQSTDFISRVLSRTLDSYRVEFDNGDVLEGTFQLTRFEVTGDYNGEQTYALTLDSSGVVTVTAV